MEELGVLRIRSILSPGQVSLGTDSTEGDQGPPRQVSVDLVHGAREGEGGLGVPGLGAVVVRRAIGGAVCAVDATLSGPRARSDVAGEVRAEGGSREGVMVLVQRVGRAARRGRGRGGTRLRASGQRRGGGVWIGALRLGWSHGRGYLGGQGRPVDAPDGGGTERGHRRAGIGGGGSGGSGGSRGGMGFVAHGSVLLHSGRRHESDIVVT